MHIHAYTYICIHIYRYVCISVYIALLQPWKTFIAATLITIGKRWAPKSPPSHTYALYNPLPLNVEVNCEYVDISTITCCIIWQVWRNFANIKRVSDFTSVKGSWFWAGLIKSAEPFMKTEKQQRLSYGPGRSKLSGVTQWQGNEFCLWGFELSRELWASQRAQSKLMHRKPVTSWAENTVELCFDSWSMVPVRW